MSRRTYVPGYGYVERNSPGTSGSVKPGVKRVDSGQGRTTWFSRTATNAANNTPQGTPGFVPDETGALGGPDFTYSPPTGVPYPLTGYGPISATGYGQASGYEYGVRQGSNPDALEAFPYGVTYRDTTKAIDAFTELDPAYQNHLNALAKHPNIGTANSTGRMLWERLVRLSQERLEQGMPNRSPQMLVAELAYSLGVSPELGREGDDPFLGSSGYTSNGGGGYGGGGGGGSSSVVLTDPTSARGLLMQTMQGVLGRNPTNDEYKKFLETLNRVEMENPRTVSMEGDVAVQSGGTDPGIIAMDFAENRPDARRVEVRKVTDLLMQALAGA